MYFCFRCDQERVLSPRTNLTAGCLFSSHAYNAPHLKRAVHADRACKYYDVATMRRLCATFAREGDQPDHRGKTYAEQYLPWWCSGLDAEVA